jgi:hypothetical protein
LPFISSIWLKYFLRRLCSSLRAAQGGRNAQRVSTGHATSARDATQNPAHRDALVLDLQLLDGLALALHDGGRLRVLAPDVRAQLAQLIQLVELRREVRRLIRLGGQRGGDGGQLRGEVRAALVQALRARARVRAVLGGVTRGALLVAGGGLLQPLRLGGGQVALLDGSGAAALRGAGALGRGGELFL